MTDPDGDGSQKNPESISGWFSLGYLLRLVLPLRTHTGNLIRIRIACQDKCVVHITRGRPHLGMALTPEQESRRAQLVAMGDLDTGAPLDLLAIDSKATLWDQLLAAMSVSSADPAEIAMDTMLYDRCHDLVHASPAAALKLMGGDPHALW